jgi:hypothetical protein
MKVWDRHRALDRAPAARPLHQKRPRAALQIARRHAVQLAQISMVRRARRLAKLQTVRRIAHEQSLSSCYKLSGTSLVFGEPVLSSALKVDVILSLSASVRFRSR